MATLRGLMYGLFVFSMLGDLLRNEAFGQKSIILSDGIVYFENDAYTLRFDLARPDRPGPHPALIYIHGGGWREGHRGAYRGEIQEAARRGYVAVSLSHRLTAVKKVDGSVKYPWPAQIIDVKACVRFLRRHADDYGIDPNRIGATGASSGGHLALMLGLSDDTDFQVCGQTDASPKPSAVSARVQALVNVAGPTDMARVFAAPIVTPYALDLMGAKPSKVPERYRQASPLTYLSADDPPILTIHGEQDEVVPVEQAHLLAAKAKQLRVVYEQMIIADTGHSLPGHMVRQKTLDFFDRYLGTPSAD